MVRTCCDFTIEKDQQHEDSHFITLHRPYRQVKMPIQYGFEDMVVYSLQAAEETELFEQSFYIETVTTKYVDV